MTSAPDWTHGRNGEAKSPVITIYRWHLRFTVCGEGCRGKHIATLTRTGRFWFLRHVNTSVWWGLKEILPHGQFFFKTVAEGTHDKVLRGVEYPKPL